MDFIASVITNSIVYFSYIFPEDINHVLLLWAKALCCFIFFRSSIWVFASIWKLVRRRYVSKNDSNIVSSVSEQYDPETKILFERMQRERLYADHDLRVGKLAVMLGLPEYQLRKRINQTLGYRNFNQFVNRFRIEEAGQRLCSDPRLPVLSVALDVGFRSISSFNTAFQNYFGMAPTAYRKQSASLVK